MLDNVEHLGENLVFINDGAAWINDWIKSTYPRAYNILDFYHASQYLYDFVKVVYSNTQKQSNWINEQRLLLLNDKIEKVIQNIESIRLTGEVKQKAKHKILTYYTNNKDRMLYKTYKEKGLLIGSGPIESAHRYVVQKRMKQSGQRWTDQGLQAIGNIRVCHLNEHWDVVTNLIR